MTVRELIKKLEEVEDKEQEVFTNISHFISEIYNVERSNEGIALTDSEDGYYDEEGNR